LGQLLFALPCAGRLVIGFGAGRIVTTMGARLAMIWGLALYVAFGVVPYFTTDVALVLASRFALGALCGIVAVAATVTLVACYEGRARDAMLGLQSAVGSAGGLFCILAAGAIASRFDWRLVFLLYPLFMAPFLFLAFLAMPAAGPQAQPSGAGLAIRASVKLLWPIYATAAGGYVVTSMFGALTPFLLVQRGEHSAFIQGLVVAAVTVGVIASSAAFARIRGAMGPTRTLALGFAAMGAGGMIMGVGPTTALSALAGFTFGLGLGVTFPNLAAAVAALTPVQLRAHAFALLGTATFIGGFLYPFVVTPLMKAIGIADTFTVFGAILVASAVAVATGRADRRLVAA
jgi:MFS family permease